MVKTPVDLDVLVQETIQEFAIDLTSVGRLTNRPGGKVWEEGKKGPTKLTRS